MTREEAIAELRKDKSLYESDVCHADDGSPDGRLIKALDMAIKSLSADAVKGEWLEIEDYNGDYHYQCSVCKDEFYLEYGTPKENGYAYCPSCGARMKGGDE